MYAVFSSPGVRLMSQNDQTTIWVTAAQSGDQAATAKLLAALHPQLRARAESKLDAPTKARTAPEDVLQEVYVQVFREVDRFVDRGPNAFRNWVFTILDHRIIDAHRAAGRQKRDAAREAPAAFGSGSSSYCNLLDHLYADSGTPSRAARQDEAVGAMLRCMGALSETHRQVIQLRFLDGLPVAEVAKRLGKTEPAVIALSKRALESLRLAMDRLGEFTRG